MNDLILQLLLCNKIGKKWILNNLEKIQELKLSQFSSVDEYLDFFSEMNKVCSISESTISKLNESFEKYKKIKDILYKEEIGYFSILDKDFPQRLKNIPDPPVFLYYKGNKDVLNNKKSVAVIGTREPTIIGEKIAREFASLLVSCNFVVVSGLALGCDQYAHEGCVENKGLSIAVLPSSIDKISPKSNIPLAEKIIHYNGCLISEYHPLSTISKSNYIERNRLQSGLSLGIFVVETDIKGGTMHTVKHSKDQGKKIGTFSHSTNYLDLPKTQGNQKLIKDKVAFPVKNTASMNDFLKYLISPNSNLKTTDLSKINSDNMQISLLDEFEDIKKISTPDNNSLISELFNSRHYINYKNYVMDKITNYSSEKSNCIYETLIGINKDTNKIGVLINDSNNYTLTKSIYFNTMDEKLLFESLISIFNKFPIN